MQQLLTTNLYLGSKIDYEDLNDKESWVFVHACKSYYERLASEITKNNKIVQLKSDFYINW